MKHFLYLSLFLSLILLTPGCAEEEPLTSNGTEASAVTTDELSDANAAVTEERGGAIVTATKRITPAVVTITTLTRVTERIYDPWSDPFFNDPFFQEFFGSGGSSEPQYREREIPGMGSGFIISEEGYVLTAEHVVHSADEIEITLPDGRAFAGEVVGRDPYSDTAVVRIIDGKDLPVATLGDSDKLVVGEWAIAVGNPFGFVVRDPQPSVTVGVISATNRVTRQQISTGEARVFEGII
ncbi:S1C family serine protease, partial [bacterium]|nr:S1C family serine protease [bacterium]